MTSAEPFVAISRFVVANDRDEAVADAFRARPHLVDDAPGFLRMEVLRGAEDPKEFWLLTWWTEPAAYDAWHASHAFKGSHAGMPRGLKLEKGRTELFRLRRIAE